MNAGFNARTSQSDEWCTPDWLWRALDSEFGFTFDGAARVEPVTVEVKDGPPLVLTEPNNKCAKYATVDNGATWTGERVFCNPPYSDIMQFIRRAFDGGAELSVLLLPVRTDSDWHRLLTERRVELRYFRKRVSFLMNGEEQSGPRFTNLIAVVKGTL